MAPYISSHLHDKVWMAPPCQVPSLDILQNLVANTRTKQSAAHMALLAPRVTGSASSGLHPAAEKTSAWIGQCVVADSGWSLVDSCTGGMVASKPQHCLITRTSDLSAWTVL